MGRGARGVTAIKLGKGDFVVGADVIAENDKYILTVTENGIGKKSDLALYRLQNRGGKGLINIKITEKLGKVIGLVTLNEEDSEIILCSEKGILNKQDTSELRSKGRATQGVQPGQPEARGPGGGHRKGEAGREVISAAGAGNSLRSAASRPATSIFLISAIFSATRMTASGVLVLPRSGSGAR